MTETNQRGGDAAAIERLAKAFARLKAEMGKVIVGQDAVVDQLLTAVFARGHCLLVGVPGLAKTLMISTLAKSLSLSFNRIQFTPDLMPSDITGTEVIQEDRATGVRQFRFVKGPVFANVILADEINRTPPKTQAALLEAMQEHQVTAGGTRHALPEPFFVLATQNPIEQEGTYPLPEAQLDRFMYMVRVDYPTAEEELRIIEQTTSVHAASPTPVVGAEDILAFQEAVRRVAVSDKVLRYALEFARRSRPKTADAPDFVKKWVGWGAGPRAGQYLVLAAKTRAALDGRGMVERRDLIDAVHPVLRHRILVNFSAEAEGVTSDKVIDQLVETIPQFELEPALKR
ncbi:MAG TPA: AAA family ATPase [Planctomycetota bacterium]|nr:AAA family ATPase [Planctomycetota bacterium]